MVRAASVCVLESKVLIRTENFGFKMQRCNMQGCLTYGKQFALESEWWIVPSSGMSGDIPPRFR